MSHQWHKLKNIKYSKFFWKSYISMSKIFLSNHIFPPPFLTKDDRATFADFSFRVPASSTEEQHAPSKLLFSRKNWKFLLVQGLRRSTMERAVAGETKKWDEEANADKAFDIRLMLEAADQSRARRGPFSHTRRQWWFLFEGRTVGSGQIESCLGQKKRRENERTSESRPQSPFSNK